MTIYVVEMNELGCGLYSGAGNLLTFVSFCDKNTGVLVICNAGYSPENTVLVSSLFGGPHCKIRYKKYVFTKNEDKQGPRPPRELLKC